MNTLYQSVKLYLFVALFACLALSAQASNRGPVIWDQSAQEVYTDTNEAFVGVDFFVDIYDIEHMKANEEGYEGYIKNLISENGANVLRVSVWMGYWQDINESSHWYQRHLDDIQYVLDKTSTWADESNAYVLISYGPSKDHERTMAFWNEIAPVFSGQSHVMFQTTSDPQTQLGRLRLNLVDSLLASLAPDNHRIYEPTSMWNRRRGAEQFLQYGGINFPARTETVPAVEDYIINSQPQIDYVIKTDVALAAGKRWNSVSGLQLEEPVAAEDFNTLTFEVKADLPQSYWVYLRDSSNQDIAAYYNTYAGDSWGTVTLTASDFNNPSGVDIASVQFFVGIDPYFDAHSSNSFYFDNLVINDGSNDTNVNRGKVDEAGTGWLSVGYGQTSTSITRELADNPVQIGYAFKAELAITPINRWHAVAALILENTFSFDDFETVSFDVKSDVAQSFWVYLRNANSVDVAPHYNTYSPGEWTTITLNKSDFNLADDCVAVEDCNVSEVHFFIGINASADSHTENAFYFDNVVVRSVNGEEQGERGKTDASGTGWFEKGFGINRSVVERIGDTGGVAPPPSEVAYDIEYVRTSGTDYYVSPEGDDSNDGLSIETAVKTPQVGADKLQAGDKLIVMPGEYPTPGYGTSISLSQSGTADNWISIEAYEPGTAHFIVRGPNGVVLNGASYVRVKGLKISGLAGSITPEEAEAIRQDNWYAEGLVGVGIGTESRQVDGEYTYPHHIIIENNHIFEMSAGGIAMKRADYILIKNNLVHNNAYYNVWAPSGISVWENHNYDDNTETYRTVITGNISYGNYNYFNFYASSSPELQERVTDGNGIIIDALAIDQGYTSDGLVGIYSGRTLIENNITYNNGGRGINLYASDNIDVVHNVSFANATHPQIDSEVHIGNVSNLRMYNNIFHVAEGENAFFEYLSSNLDVRNNIIVKDGAFADEDNLSLATDIIYDSPQFVDAQNFNFNVMPSSPAIDGAIDGLKSFEDINGIARPIGGAADIGPYEQ